MAKRSPGRISGLSAKKMGDWDGAINYLSKMGTQAGRIAKEAQKEEAEKVASRVIGHLNNQDLPWAPLSKSYKELKRANNNLTLIHTEVYVNAIGVWKSGNTYYAGVKKGIAYKGRGRKTTVEAVARYHEFGTNKMPARPLWNPTFKELGGAYGIRNRIARKIFNHIKDTAHPAITFREIRTKVPR